MNGSGAQWAQNVAALDLTGVRTWALVVILTVAALIDVRTMRIPNWLTACGALMGLGLNAAMPWQLFGPLWAIEGVLWALGGMGAGLVLLLPLYAFGLMGAGDVKLMAMVGAFLGFPQVLGAILSAFIAGGVVAVVFATYHRALRRTLSNAGALAYSMTFAALAGFHPVATSRSRPSVGRLPYGVSIWLGTLAWVTLRHLGYF